jgi:hypothetical protein
MVTFINMVGRVTEPPRDRLHKQNQGTFSAESGISLPGTDSQQIIYPSDANHIIEVCYAA